MSHKSRNIRMLGGLLSAVLAGSLLAACSQTAAPAPNIIQRAQGETPAAPSPTGFLGSDYSLMTPPARVLSAIKMAATGTYSFVGSAQGAAKLTDSVSGQLLAAWADKRVGGTSIKNVDVFQWGDAENAIDYWANGLEQRLVALGVQ